MNEYLWQEKYVDPTSNTLRGIDIEHSEIHKGRMFMATKKATVATTVHTYIGILTGANGIHYKPATIVTTADALQVTLYEGSTVTGGTAVDVVNLNRNSANVTTAVAKDGVTPSVNGTAIGTSFLGGSAGVGQTRSGGSASGVNEFVLKPNTQYMLDIYNGSTASNTFQLTYGWYEPV